jgi:glc operon protein GlcG
VARFRIALVLVGFVALPSSAFAQEKKPPLITRNRVQLNLAGAEAVLDAAKKNAASLGLKCNIAVVDDGGHLLAFARMDGARPASATTALTKAVSAATFRQDTGALPAKGEPDVLLSLSL